MFSSNDQVEFKEALKEFNAIKKEEYSYAFTTGYCESLCAELFRCLPKKDQKSFLKQITESLEKARVTA